MKVSPRGTLGCLDPCMTVLLLCLSGAAVFGHEPSHADPGNTVAGLAGAPEYFYRAGHLTENPGFTSSTSGQIASDLMPLVPLAVTSLGLGFFHQFLADRLQSRWVDVLGAPLFNMALHFWARPELNKNTLIGLLPSALDAAAIGIGGAGYAGRALGTIQWLYSTMALGAALWPEMHWEWQGYSHHMRPVVIGTDKANDRQSQSPIGLEGLVAYRWREYLC